MMQEKVIIGRRGVITIPAKLRQAFGLRQNDELIIEKTGHGLLLRPSVSVPIEIYTEDRIAEFARDDEAIGQALNRLGRRPGV